MHIALPSHSANSEFELKGSAPYTPTRIEWLTLTLESQLRHDATQADPYVLHIVSTGDDTITIYVRYFSGMDRSILNEAIETAKKVAYITAKGYGWTSWLKLKEKVELIR